MSIHEGAAALAARLRGMDEGGLRSFLRNLDHPAVPASRRVYYYGSDLVIKTYASREHARKSGQVLAEAALWKQLQSEHRPYFAEVYESDEYGFWLIQERVWALDSGQFIPNVLFRVAEEVGIGDLVSQNCGHRQGEPVILDYGISMLWQQITGREHMSLMPVSAFKVTKLPDA